MDRCATLALDGEVEIAPGIDMRLARLTGPLGADRIQLTRPLHLSKRGTDLVLSDLALTIGPGQITGDAAQRGQAFSMQLAARNLSIASAARLAGYQDIGGTVMLDANVGGTVGAPQGRFTLSGHSLRFALAQAAAPADPRSRPRWELERPRHRIQRARQRAKQADPQSRALCADARAARVRGEALSVARRSADLTRTNRMVGRVTASAIASASAASVLLRLTWDFT
jgi:hypothetical protein